MQVDDEGKKFKDSQVTVPVAVNAAVLTRNLLIDYKSKGLAKGYKLIPNPKF